MPDLRKRTPKPAPQQPDPRGLPLSPTDGFILSRIDGALSDGDLAISTGLPEDQVFASLTKLEGLGLITFDGAAEGARPAAPSSPQATEPPRKGPTPAPAPDEGPPPPRALTPFPKGVPLTPEEEAALAEDIDLEMDLRKAILGKHRKLRTADHYDMLGVPRNADRKVVKRAYFDLAAKFHPDRYFRKRLGTFKVRMEAVFARVTSANDVLGNREKRQEYDEYLAEQRRSRSIEDLLEAAVAEAQQAAESAEEEARAQEAHRSSQSQPAMQAATPTTTSPSGVRPAPTEAEAAARREALARKLLGGRQPQRPTPMPSAGAVPPAAPTPTADAMNALRRRYEDRIAQSKKAKARTYVDQADAALARGDLPSAATSLRVAANLSPGDPDLERRALEVRSKADVILGQTYTKQAAYEENSEQWGDAARSWGRVCRAMPSSVDAHSRGATAIIKARGDLHEAARMAKRACELEPDQAKHRVLLGSVYLSAGLGLNARRELETAAQMAPHDDTVKEMIRRLGVAP